MNLLRNRIAGNEYRDYSLGFIFYMFLSEQLLSITQEALAEDGLDYTKLVMAKHIEIIGDIKEEVVDTLGYHLNNDQLFNAIAKQIHDQKKDFILGQLT